MDLGVLEGQTSRGLFSNSIFDPSVIGANGDPNFLSDVAFLECKKVTFQSGITKIDIIFDLPILLK